MRRYVHLGDVLDLGIVWDFGPEGVTIRDVALCGSRQFVFKSFEEVATSKLIEANVGGLGCPPQVVRLPDGKPLEYAQPVPAVRR